MSVAVSCTDPDIKAAKALTSRVAPEYSSRIKFVKTDSERDEFALFTEGRHLVIEANNANSMAVGLNHYLKYYCLAEFGWLLDDKPTLPKQMPAVREKVHQTARVADRFFLNYCTSGYTMPWWQWEDWEHLIDWMALNGVNLPLATTGQEAVWYEVWKDYGLSDEQIRSYFTGPAHLPWHRMQNIDRWGGPLPMSYIEGQKKLQKKIVARERELGMRPVLPAFAGHVPSELTELQPDAPIEQLAEWAGFPGEFACSFLDPMSDLYADIQRRFMLKEAEFYGTDHVYGVDLFNEMVPPSWEPEYLARVSSQVYETMKAADDDAVWLQMGWLFYYDRKHWTEDRVEAYLSAVPAENQILLDYYCENQEVWRRTDSFYGVPFIWCYLGNFGGNTYLNADLANIDRRFEAALAEAGQNLRGIGSTLEGFDLNPHVYEYVFEKAWDGELHRDVHAWTERLADQRAGHVSAEAREAWKLLTDSIFLNSSPLLDESITDLRPSFGRFQKRWQNPALDKDLATMGRVVESLLKSGAESHAAGFDLVNYAAILIEGRFLQGFGLYEQAYEARDVATMSSMSSSLLDMLDDLETLLSTQSYFLVGKWIADARKWAEDGEEADYYEMDARNILTTWGPADMGLNDYASRSWAGLVGTYHKARWAEFFDSVSLAVADHGEFNEVDEEIFHGQVTDFEKRWWEECIGVFSASAKGDSYHEVKAVAQKYICK